MFGNIPNEMQGFPQWVAWLYVDRDGGKPAKIPIDAKTGKTASVTNPETWCSYEHAVSQAHNYSGIGFVFTLDDPFCGIDLDDTHGDDVALSEQKLIYEKFNSYSELSPSGKGLHIIIKGRIPQGRRRSGVEVYSSQRFFTVTGN